MKSIPQHIYNNIIKNVPIACVDVAILHNDRILLVKRKDRPAKNQYWVPGGRVHKGEMMRDAAFRKCVEEVGLYCHIGPIVHTAETLFQDGPHHIPVHSINSCFLAVLKNPDQKIHLDEHHQDFKWVSSISELPNLNPYVISCLKGAGIPE